MTKETIQLENEQKFWKDAQMNKLKDAQHCMSLGSYKFKQWYISIGLLEYLKYKALQTPNIGKVAEQQWSQIIG